MERCNFSNCKAKAEFYCLCSHPKYLTCSRHVQNHLDDETKNHNLKNIMYVKPNADTKNELLEYLKNKEQIVEEKEENLKKLKLRLHSGNPLETKHKKYMSFLNNLREKIQKTEKISEFEEDAYIKLLRLNPKNALEKLKRKLPKLIDEEYNFEMVQIGFENIIEDNNMKFEELKVGLSMISESQDSLKATIKEIFENMPAQHPQNIEPFWEESSISLQESDALRKNKYIIEDLEYKEVSKHNKLKAKMADMISEVGNFPYCKCCEHDTLPSRLENLAAGIVKIKKKFEKIKIASENMHLYHSNKGAIDSYQDLVKLNDDLLLKFSDIQTNIDNQIVNSKNLLILDQDFINRKTRITELNTMNNHLEQRYIENNKKQLSSLTCPIPYSDDLLVCVNGFFRFGEVDSGYSCIINTKTNLVTKILKPFTPSKWVGGIKYKSDIFLFGGTAVPTGAWKYNIEDTKWDCLNSMPEGAERCSCVIWKDSILICGKGHKNIWKYIIAEGTYEKIEFLNENGPDPNMKKILFVSQQTIYLQEQEGRLFFSDRNNELQWHMVKRDPVDNFYREYKSFHNGKVFIGLVLYTDAGKYDGFYYYHFNDEERKLVKIKEEIVKDDFNVSFFQAYNDLATEKWWQFYNSIKENNLRDLRDLRDSRDLRACINMLKRLRNPKNL